MDLAYIAGAPRERYANRALQPPRLDFLLLSSVSRKGMTSTPSGMLCMPLPPAGCLIAAIVCGLSACKPLVQGSPTLPALSDKGRLLPTVCAHRQLLFVAEERA